MILQNRRAFLATAAAVAAAAPALQACATAAPQDNAHGLVADPGGLLDLPPGFAYRVLSRAGEPMSDGLDTPAAFDGMAAFPLDGGRCALIRNHEIRPTATEGGAFGADFSKAAAIDRERIYDRAPNGRPLLGGTTTLIVDVRTLRVEQSFLSVAGTATNCAGGATPWGAWLTCEETLETPGANATKPHGFAFEVPASARGLVRPEPLVAMGRFRREAAAVDPTTGVVYQTEDEEDGLLYRFLPDAPGELARGGRLQALALAEWARGDTRNWRGRSIAAGARLPVRWVDLDHVESPDGDLKERGHARGAALFARGEGMALAIEGGRPAIYFACTTGGVARRGQVWRLNPGPEGDTLDLFAESASDQHFDMVDNIVAAPWGDLILCEDGDGDNFVRGLSANGATYPIARNAHRAKSEFCGACFSPDGSTLFVNVQTPSRTFAITGDWAALARGMR
jgi:hypothetical protein